ncbi:hypothetical protein F8388_015655 [Cannabis sativa]|uniref:Uncharacterized protein n=1 Tax=Cannabis sativa TaxID=3483 RepID=A0A7J6I601_CANSA|nr:hypothetical protein F8388_015655 [Cannabis sativa]KAF4402973.1 hypothetical protein G4B88_010425 [Cannabis sativa]
MVGGALVEGSGRRLPQWMLGSSSDVQAVEKSGKTTESTTKQPEESLSSRTLAKCSRKGSLHSSDALVKCRTGKRKVEAEKVDAYSDTEISVDEQDNKSNRTRRKLSKPSSQKRRKTKKLEDVEKEDIQPMNEGDDFELTVDDLLTIAKEYVRANKDKEEEQEVKGKFDSRSRPLTTISSSINSEDCKQSSTTNDNTSSFIQTSTTNCIGASYKANDSSSATEESVIKAGGTGDPAHDMLNLFLGPLLRNL